MTIYNWLTLLGIPSISIAIISCLIKKLKDNNKKCTSIQLGVQYLLRDRLDQLHNSYITQGWCDQHQKRLFENLYNQYKNLRDDSVMAEAWEEVKKLPTKPPQND